jgi:hypothetical protein
MWPPIVLAQFIIDRQHILSILKETVGIGYELAQENSLSLLKCLPVQISHSGLVHWC